MKQRLMKLLRPWAIRALLLRERVTTGASWNPLDPEYRQNPFPTYRRLRQHDPIHRSTLMKGWVLSRFDDVDAVLRDYKHFGSDERNAGIEIPSGESLGEEGRSMLALDPPDHTRLRSLVNKAFTPRAVEAIQPRIEELVDELLDAIEGDHIDLIEALAYPLPVIVIAEMLGVRAEDREQFKEWSDALAVTLEPTISPEQMEAANVARQALWAYFGGIIEERREDPQDDLVSQLIAAEDEGDQLTHQELLSTLGLLLVAGNETTTNLIGNGMLALLRHPDQLSKLREQPELVESAVEELLRFDSPVQVDGRMVLEETTVGGRRMKRGEQLILLLGAANRDPDVYEEPERLDIERDARSHIGFGRGIHHCLGAPLARVEGRIAFGRLIERVSSIRLRDEPVFREQIVLRGLTALPVEVERAAAEPAEAEKMQESA
jgi:cytochrome P450